MSLKECKECGNSVSTKARRCPNCGTPIKKRRLFMWSCLLLLVCLSFYWSYIEYYKDVKVVLEDQIKTWINEELEWSKELELWCTFVYLVQESSRKYTGYAEFETGERLGVVVTVDNSGEAMFEINRADAFMLGTKKNLE